MRRIGLVLFSGVEVLDFAGPWEVFGVIAPHVSDEVLGVAASLDPVVSARKLRFVPDATFTDCPQFDVILVPGGAGTQSASIGTVVEFVKAQAPGAEIVASVCTGAFVLQEAGLLERRRGTTHWQSKERLRETCVNVVDERYVIDGNIWTSAGVSAGIDMALAIVGRLHGEDVGRRVQRGIEYDPAPPFDIGHPAIHFSRPGS
jgi:cyclohexyl-isocyanide hydratase